MSEYLLKIRFSLIRAKLDSIHPLYTCQLSALPKARDKTYLLEMDAKERESISASIQAFISHLSSSPKSRRCCCTSLLPIGTID